ncbi:hypothetical protein [Streptomyces sp. NBC_00385]|uniref:hypothetical protein n=1 Tax=Streptomyces sp. NBC_00385 TaxID=2975733 RepID=UPI002DD98934|nr:hypothetical protein [Streptomyces sp. NBC_00385]WRZ05082.1 hypothetical protein OG959_17845 [Streptomyces sp. NBC_00385]
MAEPWATPEELRLHLRLATIDEAQAAEKIAAAETVIRAELQQSIDAVAGAAIDLVGNGRRVINLPERPVTAVASVTIDGHTPLISTEYRWNRYGILTRLGGCWPLDAAVTVLCDYGYATTPAPVKQVCLQVAGRAWVRPSTGLAAESLGDRSVTYDKDRTGEALSDYELRILGPYGRGPESR